MKLRCFALKVLAGVRTTVLVKTVPAATSLERFQHCPLASGLKVIVVVDVVDDRLFVVVHSVGVMQSCILRCQKLKIFKDRGCKLSSRCFMKNRLWLPRPGRSRILFVSGMARQLLIEVDEARRK